MSNVLLKRMKRNTSKNLVSDKGNSNVEIIIIMASIIPMILFLIMFLAKEYKSMKVELFSDKNLEILKNVGKFILAIVVVSIISFAIYALFRFISRRIKERQTKEMEEYEMALKTISTPIEKLMTRYRQEDCEKNNHIETDIQYLKKKYNTQRK